MKTRAKTKIYGGAFYDHMRPSLSSLATMISGMCAQQDASSTDPSCTQERRDLQPSKQNTSCEV